MSDSQTIFRQNLPGIGQLRDLSAFNMLTTYEEQEVISTPLYKITAHRQKELYSDIIISMSISSYRLTSLLLSTFVFSVGILDILMYLYSGNYFFHPYFALIITLGSASLLTTTILAIRGH
ncbi:MAG: hypothetical protein A2908_01165 [Candidatus Staskawiczbacteria bacterium RIFCSPLOWO2_01_FULL_38_12b]|uniref:Uncharacterized protein n=1 Tax=Candidatus Staskawiczbacteria bacterium RIFCSPLOWO2_01_FULL_38_12b TaxID=1802214 RepID=A0A1G2IEI4_9BACT|nr:MAG: hypothetical protein A2908_01165 [Candidatus Staskawiczbacteria bacterium RIFCSPLOWO2_01_FULL_38_12b]